MQVSDLTQFQRQQLNAMTQEIMGMAVMWALDHDNQLKMRNLGLRSDAATRSAHDLICEAMGDFPGSTADIKPSAFNDFLVTLGAAR